MRSVYFDYNATTPLDPAVPAAMNPFISEVFGNPSSLHHVGRRARAALDDARDRVARLLSCRPSEIVFTSGGTESNNLAVFGTARLLRDKGRHLITSPTEHHAVLHCFEYLARKEGFELSLLNVNSDGLVDPDEIRALIRPDTVLVSVMAANNETGVIQPVAEIGSICREKGVLFHTDAVQWFGKESVQSIHSFNANLVSVCGHKFHGPRGSGLLFIRSPFLPEPVLFGGGHENERRAGTENLSAIVGLVEAMDRFTAEPVFCDAHLLPLRSRLEQAVTQIDGCTLTSASARRLNNTVSFTVAGCDSISLLAGLDLEGICASSGSACSAGSLEPSHVLAAMGVSDDLANSFVRFSLGRESTLDEVEFAKATLPLVIQRIRGY